MNSLLLTVKPPLERGMQSQCGWAVSTPWSGRCTHVSFRRKWTLSEWPCDGLFNTLYYAAYYPACSSSFNPLERINRTWLEISPGDGVCGCTVWFQQMKRTRIVCVGKAKAFLFTWTTNWLGLAETESVCRVVGKTGSKHDLTRWRWVTQTVLCMWACGVKRKCGFIRSRSLAPAPRHRLRRRQHSKAGKPSLPNAL